MLLGTRGVLGGWSQSRFEPAWTVMWLWSSSAGCDILAVGYLVETVPHSLIGGITGCAFATLGSIAPRLRVGVGVYAWDGMGKLYYICNLGLYISF